MTTEKGKSLLENAYRLATPDDNITYYKAFSKTYDSDFVDALGFTLPISVADHFRKRVSTASPIADLGCGTGQVAEALRDLSPVIDGLDISKDMLRVAANRQVYRNLIELDLTRDVGQLANSYGAVLSSGTFTHGHLGPEALDNTLMLGKPGCVFVLSINTAHYAAKGFKAALDALKEDGSIHALQIEDVPIYDKQGHDHSDDRAFIVSFQKT